MYKWRILYIDMKIKKRTNNKGEIHMIQVDKEINFTIHRLKVDLKSTNIQITFFYIIHKFIWLIFFIYAFFILEGLNKYIDNVNLLLFLYSILLILTVFTLFCCNEYLKDMIIKKFR